MTEIAANKGVKREDLKNGAYAHEPVQWHRRDRPCGGVGGVQEDSPMRDGRVRKQGVGKKFQRSA